MITNKEAITYFKRHLDLYCVDGISRESEEMAIKALEQQKTGHWIITNDYYTGAYSNIDYVECSCCHEYSLEEGDYCPNCGAKMAESEEVNE